MDIIEKVQKNCGLSRSDAKREFDSAKEVLLADEKITLDNVEEFTNDLGLDIDDIMSNPECLL